MVKQPENEAVEVQQLAGALKEFAAEVIRHSARDMHCLLRSNNLSMPQVAALMYLRHHGTASISDISTYLNLSLAATSQLVERLVVHAYVSRTEDPDDRRLKRVMLAEAGAAMVEEVRQARVEEVARRLAQMPPPLYGAALDILGQMTAFLRAGESHAAAAPDEATETSIQHP